MSKRIIKSKKSERTSKSSDVHYNRLLDNIDYDVEKYDFTSEGEINDFEEDVEKKEFNTEQTPLCNSVVESVEDMHGILFQGSSDLMLYLDLRGRITKINRAGIAFSGFSEDEMIGQLFWKIPGVFSKRNIPKYLKAFKNTIRGEPTESFLSELHEKSGKKHIMEFSTYPIKENRKITSILVVGKDITEQKESENKLHETGERYRLIAENTSDFVSTLTFTLNPKFTYISPAHRKILGYEDLINKSVFDFIHPDDKKHIRSLLKKYLSAKTKSLLTGKNADIVENIEFRAKDASGRWHHFESTVNIAGKGIVAVSKDITNRKQREKKLRGSEERFRAVFESAQDSIFIKDLELRYTLVNPSMEKLFGIPASDLIGKTDDELFGVESGAHVKDVDSRALNGEIVEEEHTKPINGIFHTFHVIKVPMHDNTGNVIGLCGIARDITDRKNAEEELQVVHHELERRVKKRTAELAKANKDLQAEITRRRKLENTLQESEKRFRDIFENSLIGIYRTTPNGKILMANSALVQMLGYSSIEDLCSGNLENERWYHPQYSRSEFKKRIKSSGQIIGLESTWIKKDGSTLFIRESVTAVHDNDGNIIYYEGTVDDITDRKKIEEENNRTKEYLQNIINSASEIIISFDKNFGISIWNKTAELVTGFKRKQVIGKRVTELSAFDNSEELLNALKNICCEEKARFDEFTLRTKKGDKRIIRACCSAIKGNGKQCTGVLIIGKDVTHDIENHGKLSLGNSYLIPDKNNRSAIHLFINLARSDYNALVITRHNPKNIKSILLTKDIQIVMLKENKSEGYENISDLDGLIAKIMEFSKKKTKTVILLDRIDYLLTKFSFEQFIESLYQINDIISENNSILLLHLNPSILDEKQMTIIESELQPLPSQKIEGISLRDDLYDILKFIYEQNQDNVEVSFRKISKELSISSNTAAKRLGNLEDKGVILIKKQGRSKAIYVSEKGKTLLHKRQII